ncbi:DUF4381 domain-containing protein [Congregibacter sp.]|uniref:DUF4381 domain-containing protein n=1 Tax=Congregibacter sp. TaxID=2744308 RepID=UPI003F6C3A69
MLEPLRDPAAVHWWPLAPGWWLLALVVLSLMGYGLYRLWRFHLRAAPLRAGRKAFASLEQAELSNSEQASELGLLQRKVAIGVAGRKACAGLTGQEWAEFLNGLTKSKEAFFDASLTQFAYQAQIDRQDCDSALQATRRWLQDLERPQ